MDSPITSPLPTDANSIIASLGAGATEDEKAVVRRTVARSTQLAMEWPTANDQSRELISDEWLALKSTLLTLGESRAQVVTSKLENVLLTLITAVEGTAVTSLLNKIPTV